jgi:biotin synthase-related radical SAM superfamily protein
LHSRDIELLLPEDILARCPVGTRVAAQSPYTLHCDNDRFFVAKGTDERVDVSVVPPPTFYRDSTTNGTPMWQIGTVHAGYLSIDPAIACGFAAMGVACQFCTIQGAAPHVQPAPHDVDEVLEVVGAAFAEGAAEFVYFNTGYFDSEDGGFGFLEPYVTAVKKHFDTIVALQVHPPRDDRWIDRTYAAGVDALSYAIEIHDPDILAEVCKGRCELIGRERYYEALAHAARIFPSGTVWSHLILGLEPLESTRAGIDVLTGMGVLPVLSLFRPLDETALGDRRPPDPETIAPVYAHLYTAVREAKINVQLMRDLGYAITPIEARFFVGDDAKLDVAASSFYKSRLGSRAVRGLSKLRRRLRVKRVSESFGSSRL